MAHKSTEGIGMEDFHSPAEPASEIHDAVASEHDAETSKIIKTALGGVAAGALLAGIYELTRYRLNKKKEQ
jgi:hypothetical protein